MTYFEESGYHRIDFDLGAESLAEKASRGF